jgi:UDP-galactopyranose mutase
VGAGLYGSTFAHEISKTGKKCLIIDKRNHIGGNCYTENQDGINIHKYGPHIFHTNDDFLWTYVNQFIKFNNFKYEPIANYKGELYNLPFNMNTFHQLWKVNTPTEAMNKINSDKLIIKNPKNLEEFALSNVGKDIYKKLIYGYTHKQWGKDPKDLPTSIIKRIPLRFTFDNNYFKDKHQGIPIGGYTQMISNMIGDVEYRLNTDFYENKEYFESISKKIIFTGKIDEFFNYEFGELEYRSLKFETEIIETENVQGVAGMNYTDLETPWTRIIEHKHFEFTKSKHSIITKEYPQKYDGKNEAYYPINDDRNNKMYSIYKNKSKELDKYIFGGRLGMYQYLDMHQVIASALTEVEKQRKENE